MHDVAFVDDQESWVDPPGVTVVGFALRETVGSVGAGGSTVTESDAASAGLLRFWHASVYVLPAPCGYNGLNEEIGPVDPGVTTAPMLVLGLVYEKVHCTGSPSVNPDLVYDSQSDCPTERPSGPLLHGPSAFVAAVISTEGDAPEQFKAVADAVRLPVPLLFVASR